MFLEVNNYRISQLKEICRHYKLKLGGNKDELTNRVYNYLRLSKYSKRIQCLEKYLSKICGLQRTKLD